MTEPPKKPAQLRSIEGGGEKAPDGFVHLAEHVGALQMVEDYKAVVAELSKKIGDLSIDVAGANRARDKAIALVAQRDEEIAVLAGKLKSMTPPAK